MKWLKIAVAVFAVLVVVGAINRLLSDTGPVSRRPPALGPVAKSGESKASKPYVLRTCQMIITDEEMRDWTWGEPDDEKRVAKVQKFLKEKGSILADEERMFKYRPSAYIVAAAKEAKINPLVILVTLQKEQGLIVGSDPAASNYRGRVGRLDWAMGYGKPSTLWQQIADGTWQFNYYMTSPWLYNFQAGKGRETQDGVMIWPQNNATAALYNYTPYAGKRCGGAENVGGTGLFLELWSLWQDWQPVSGK